MSQMPQNAWRLLVVLACSWAAAGCISLPSPSPARVPTPPGNAEDEHSGWLFQRLTGQKPPDAPQNPSPGTPNAAQNATVGQNLPSGTVLASATEPIAGQPGTPTGPPGNLSRPAAPQPVGSPPPTAVPIPGAGAFEPKAADDKKSGFEISDLAPDKVYKDLKKSMGYGPNESIARTAYQEGQALFQQKQYDEAAAKFNTASWRWPDSVLEEDALFMLGESYFFADRYSKAKDAYDNLLKKFTNSRHLDVVVTRQFAIGRYWEQLHMANPHWPVAPNFVDKGQPLFDTFGNAIAAYESVRLHDPVGPLADAAVMATGNAYFRKGRYEDAAYQYDLLRKEYPKSKYQMEAHLLDLQAKQLVYQGPVYEGKTLDDAEEIAKQTLTQFGTKLGPEKERVLQAANRLREEKAQRQWAMGQYYEKKKYYGAARSYYQLVLQEFPSTQTARMAQTRIEEIKDKPDVPVNYFKWLNDLIPTERR